MPPSGRSTWVPFQCNMLVLTEMELRDDPPWSGLPEGCSVNLGFLLRSEQLVFAVLMYISYAARKDDCQGFLISLAFISCDISNMTDFILLGLWWISWLHGHQTGAIFNCWFLFFSHPLVFRKLWLVFLLSLFFLLLRAWSLLNCLYIGRSCWVLLVATLLLCFNSRISGI